MLRRLIVDNIVQAQMRYSKICYIFTSSQMFCQSKNLLFSDCLESYLLYLVYNN